MIKNFIVLGQAIVIGVLALTLVITSFSYHMVKEDRNEWANFMIEAWTVCEYRCENCLDKFSYTWRWYWDSLDRQEINYE
jgi:hypothetical protein